MYRYFWVTLVAAAALLVFSLQWMIAEIGPWRIDLEVYRHGVEAWWNGRNIYGKLPPSAGGLDLPFIYPPFSLVVLLPFAVLPFSPAVVTLFVVNLLCLGVTLYVVARSVWQAGGTRGALAVSSLALPLVLFLEPINATFRFGQINIILMALVAVDCLVPKPRWARGIGVGLAAAIKLTPAAFVLYFLVRRDFRAAITAAVTAVAASAIGFAIAPEASVDYWFGGLAGASKVGGVPFLTNQSVQAVVVRLGFSSLTTTVVWLVLVLVLLAAVIAAMRRADPATALMVNAGFALLASPTSWSHYWIWVAPALVVMLAAVVRHARAGSLAGIGWLVAAAATAVVCYLAPFNGLPGFDNREMSWTSSQQVLGASYPLLGYALILAYALPAILRRNSADQGTWETPHVGAANRSSSGEEKG
ncbi:MAG: alpha,2-mannosyltransferase [Actinomycetota bacterium]|nr:alpha,2-mannosyltransferase [Actinomycetota bacterium]